MQDRTSPETIQAMFNTIAPTYDKLNHLLSFGLDIRWRRKAIRLMVKKRGGMFLDIAAGSGDVSFDLLKLHPQRIVGTDFALNMLSVFQQKLSRYDHSCPIEIVSCDAHSLPFLDQTFDGTIVAFGIRNFADRLRALKEMFRVLKPQGLAVILELSKPTAPIVKQLYTVYARFGLPLLGKIISKHNSAYQYLPESIVQFPVQSEFLSLMNVAGFSEIKALPLSFGAATIYVGRKSGSGPTLVETPTTSGK